MRPDTKNVRLQDTCDSPTAMEVAVLPADEAAFRDYVARGRRDLVRTAYLLTGDWHAAEALTQDCLARLYVVWTKVRQRSDADLHARRILLSVYFDSLGKPWRRLATAPQSTASDSTPAADSDEAPRERLRVALDRIPPKQRAALVLRYWEGRSLEQTADLLNCSIATVRTRTTRALKRLNEALEQPAPDTMGRTR